jgi:hypothetical protein
VRIDAAGFHTLTGSSVSVAEISADYAVDGMAHHVNADAGSAGVTVTLPHAGDCSGRVLVIVKVAGAGDVTVNAQSGDFINAATSKVISTTYAGLRLVSTGQNVWITHVLTPA